MSEPETKRLPSYLFFPKSPGPLHNLGVTAMSSDTERLNSLSRDSSFKGYRVRWMRLRRSEYDPRDWIAVDQPVGREFVLWHYEPPRSIFGEGDFLSGPFESNTSPADCASSFEYWKIPGVSVGSDGDHIGLLEPLTRASSLA